MAHLNRKIGIPSFDLTGKTAIITGGTQGLGFGMACALAAYGCNVVITARTASKVEDAAADLNENYCKGGRALGIPADSSKLESIKEVMNIRWNKDHDGVEFEEDGEYKPLAMGTPVSMNFWGFTPATIKRLEKIFNSEIEEGIRNNPLKYEALLPNHVGDMVRNGECQVRVLTSNDSWFGVTYKEDKPVVIAKIQALKDKE